MAATKGPYDPIKAVEGMFNGSVTRIAYALKDPADYGGSTKTVLAECAKRFHDALDDCEIQMLDAKWYLEQQLKTNRLRREEQAREVRNAAKRKHDELKDTSEQTKSEETATKKAKIESVAVEQKPAATTKPKETTAEVKPEQSNGTSTISKPQATPNTSNKPVTNDGNKPKEPPLKQIPAPPKEASNPIPVKDQPVPDEFSKPTPQATPTGTNDDFNFESMFGEPTNDLMDDAGKDGDDLNFDFTTDDMMGDPTDADKQDPNSLDSLLPGLESYANQTDDFLGTGNMNNINDLNANNNNDNHNHSNNNNNSNTNPSNLQDPNSMPTFSNDFGLPDLGAPNVFDDFLNDDSLGGMDGGGNFVDNIDLSDSALLDMDFDSVF